MGSVWNFFQAIFQFSWKMANDWPVGTIFFILIFALMAFALAILIYAIFSFADEKLGSKRTGEGIIVGLSYVPAHTDLETTYNVPLNMPMTELVSHDNRWSVRVRIPNVGEAWMDVNGKFYRSVNKGRRVKAKYSLGILTRKIYLQYLSTM